MLETLAQKTNSRQLNARDFQINFSMKEEGIKAETKKNGLSRKKKGGGGWGEGEGRREGRAVEGVRMPCR